MCQRYVLPGQAAAEREFLPGQAWWRFAERFNVCPGQYVPAIRLYEGQSEGVMMRWGLIPAWAEGEAPEISTVCADAEDMERSDVFRMPWVSGQRCILPFAGFFTWRLTEEKYRQPYFVRLPGRPVFGVAAVWDRSVDEDDDDVIESCSVIRVAANDLLANIANTEPSMPAILRRRDYETWLRGTPAEARSALASYKPAWMEAHAVSPRINSAEPDDPDLIRPVPAAAYVERQRRAGT